jgi:hypothetical protein
MLDGENVMAKCKVIVRDYAELDVDKYIKTHSGSNLRPRKTSHLCNNDMPDDATMCDNHLIEKYKLHAAPEAICGKERKLLSNEGAVYREKDVIEALRKAENNVN